MRAASFVLLGLFLFFLLPEDVQAQGWGTVEGRVAQAATGDPLPGATVLVAGTNFGTAAGENGRYVLRVPAGTYALRITAVGFEAETVDSVTVRRDRATVLDVALRDAVMEMEGVTVEDSPVSVEAGVYELDPEQVQNIPSPLKDGFRALKVLPGVATNNELSSQYSVRGGGYNENLIFIDGFEVYMPFRPRQGEQEGLGLLNPALSERITFYAGGFPARYGGKLSSALDVKYRRPDRAPLSGSASLSLLDADVNASASALDGKLGWAFGLRKAQAERFFSTQELQGDYRPDFTDVQGTLTFRLTPGQEIEALGIWADHEFLLDPNTKRTYYGLISLDPDVPSDLRSLYTEYEGEQRDGYTTRFGGARLKTRLSRKLRMEHDAAYFGTEERSRVDVSGRSILFQEDPGGGGSVPIGYGEQADEVDNSVAVETLTGRGRYLLSLNRHAPEAGWHVRGLHFEDRIDERLVHTRFENGEEVEIEADRVDAAATFDAWQAGLYAQDAIDVLPERGKLLLTAGVRADYFSFNEEWTVSPRLSVRYEWSENTMLTGAWGLYHQKPTYREFRGKPEPGEEVLGAVNRDLKSQQSMQFVFGGEHFLPERRLYVRAEAYYKRLRNLISYDIENVRVLYSGENDAEGYAYGLDLQLRGEFVPGLESWFNYSYLVAREAFLPAFETRLNDGLVPRPTDQRHTFSAFIQDYVPGDETWKLHMRGLFGSGLPYTPPIQGEALSNGIYRQVPGPRSQGRLPEYRRIDVGATKILPVFENGIGGEPVTLSLTAEILNIFDMVNTVAYTWDGQFNRIPTRLTPRTVNARLRLEF